MMIEKENVEPFLINNSGISEKKSIQNFLTFILLICIPTALFGKYAEITKLIMLPIVIIMSLWGIYLIRQADKKRTECYLFFGISCVFLPLSLLLAAYKLALTEFIVPKIYILLISALFLIGNTLDILITLRLIKKGYFENRKTYKGLSQLSLTFGILGLLIARLTGKNTDQETAVSVVVACFLILGFLYSMGTQNFIKYYYSKKLAKE